MKIIDEERLSELRRGVHAEIYHYYRRNNNLIMAVVFRVMTPCSLVCSHTSMKTLNVVNEPLDNGRYDCVIPITCIDINVEKTNRFLCSSDSYVADAEICFKMAKNSNK
jgi:hypothetical protein